MVSFTKETCLQGKLLQKEGTIVGIDVKTCQERCKKKQDCQWHSYNKMFQLCIHWETCKTMKEDTDYISGQSECSDIHHELDNPKIDNPELENPKLDSPYKCNLTGMCQVSCKPTVHRGRRVWQNRISILLFFGLRVQFSMYKDTLDTLQVLPIG